MIYSQEAEQACLGAMMIDQQAAAKAFVILDAPEDFVPEVHRLIFAAMQAIYDRNEPVGLPTVSDELRLRGELASVGGGDYLTALLDKPFTIAHVTRYANIVAEHAVRRDLTRIGQQLADDAPDAEDTAGLLDDISGRIFRLRTSRVVGQSSLPISQAVEGYWDWQWEIMEKPQTVAGARLGLNSIDRIIGGFADWEIVMLKAQEKFGKTRLLRHSILSTAIVGLPVFVYVLEGNLTRWLQGCVAWLADVPAKLLGRGGKSQQTDAQEEQIAAAMGQLPALPIKLACNLRTVQEIQADILASWYAADPTPAAIYIDYLQLMNNPQVGNRVEEIKSALEMMLSLNAQLGVPIITASQINREDMTFYSSEAQHAASLVFQIERGPRGEDVDPVEARMRDEIRLINTHKRYGPMLRPRELKANWATGRFYEIAGEYDDAART